MPHPPRPLAATKSDSDYIWAMVQQMRELPSNPELEGHIAKLQRIAGKLGALELFLRRVKVKRMKKQKPVLAETA